jgi:hypothetical protein
MGLQDFVDLLVLSLPSLLLLQHFSVEISFCFFSSSKQPRVETTVKNKEERRTRRERER